MKVAQVGSWIEEHPIESVVIGGGVLIALIWLLGGFGSSSSQANSGQSNLASAYYAAEQAQAVVGGQIQVANIQATRDTAIAGLQANAAQAIQKTQAHAAITINGQNATTASALGNDQLLATESSNAAAIATTQSNNNAAVAMNANDNNTNFLVNYTNSVIAPELASPAGQRTGGGAFVTPFGTFNSNTGSLVGNVNDLIAEGYTPAQAARLTGVG